jgi:hypothetical protein
VVGEHTGPDLSGYELDLRPRQRPGFSVRVHLCTWDLVVLRVDPAEGGRPVFVVKDEDDVRTFLRELDSGRRDLDLATALRRPPWRRLQRPPRRRSGARLGVEHEYRVHGPEGLLDVRDVVDDLDLGVRADPTDPHAQRGAWGGVVTADGAEAEVATPPVAVAPGAVADVVALAARGRGILAAALGEDHHLEGYSTHLNVSAPRRGDVRLATRFATTFAPSLMLLLDRTTSPGLLVRPRPGRLELGGEFADGVDLEVALTFALGAVLASGGRRREVARLRVEVGLERAVERYGWYVDRAAFGCDLYDLGRDAPLRLHGSRTTVTAGTHLERSWAIARDRLTGTLGPDELARVDAVVGGAAALPRRHDGVESKR